MTVIKNVVYQPSVQLRKLKHYSLDDFDINSAAAYGLLDVADSNIAYSKWVSPKRTRSYPLARLYNIYHIPKRVTVIPVVKDEGAGGDNDRINFITLSWMNLANIYVVLAWYDDAKKHRSRNDKITGQRFEADYVREKIQEIYHYQQTALHWNVMHFNRDFAEVFENAITSYERIATQMSVPMHDMSRNRQLLEKFRGDGQFSLEAFKQITLPASFQAVRREIVTDHELEYLSEGAKGYFSITNFLGGEYHLTADEILRAGDMFVIQESKNSSKDLLPKSGDILDGLFKLILFSNMDELYLNDKKVAFRVQLKLTGKINGMLQLPVNDNTVDNFVRQNQLRGNHAKLLKALAEEARVNKNLTIIVSSNQ